MNETPIKTIKLSEAGTELVISPAPNKYVVAIAPEIHTRGFLIVRAGTLYGEPSDKFTHANVACKKLAVHHFRTYFKSGRKRWYVKIGCDIYFIIPTDKVEIVFKEGYSYIYGLINGLKINFNVCGGTINGWTDWLTPIADIGCTKKVSFLKQLAAVATPTSLIDETLLANIFYPLNVPLEKAYQDIYDREVAEHKGYQKLLEVAQKTVPRIKLIDGLTSGGRVVSEGDLVEVVHGRRIKWEKPDEKGNKSGLYVDSKRVKYFIVMIDGSRYRTKKSQINWVETLKLLEAPVQIPA